MAATNVSICNLKNSIYPVQLLVINDGIVNKQVTLNSSKNNLTQSLPSTSNLLKINPSKVHKNNMKVNPETIQSNI